MTGVLGPERPQLEVQLAGASRMAQFFDYAREGVWHIGIGIDHILFLVSLLPPAVLADLGLPREALLVALVGFNLGVEAGQLAIVCALLPAAFLTRRHWFYRRVVFTGGSAAIAVVATVRMAERIFVLKIL